MKIIAVTNESHDESDRSYLVEITNREISLLVRNEQWGIACRIGQELQLHDAWIKINILDHKQKDLESASRNMRALADMLEREVTILKLPDGQVEVPK